MPATYEANVTTILRNAYNWNALKAYKYVHENFKKFIKCAKEIGQAADRTAFALDFAVSQRRG